MNVRQDPDLDEIDVVGGGLGRHACATQSLIHQARRAQRTGLHVLSCQIPLPLQSPQVIVDAVGGPNAHARADLAQRRRVTPVVNGLTDEVENHLLALREPLHRAQKAT